jgi:hypothetical protein
MSTLSELRATIDPPFVKIHRELTDCYYQKKAFRTLGVLTAEQFKKLHYIIKGKRLIAVHAANLKLTAKDQVSMDDYNNIFNDFGTIADTFVDRYTTKLAILKTEGFDLVID